MLANNSQKDNPLQNETEKFLSLAEVENINSQFDDIEIAFDESVSDTQGSFIANYEKEKKARKALKRNSFDISYGDSHKVSRVVSIVTNSDREIVAKKATYPKHLVNGQWENGLGDRSKWPLYNEHLLTEERVKDKWVGIAEGEPPSTYATARGIITISICGSLSGDKKYIDTKFKQLKELGIKGILIYSDNDETGAKKARELDKIATDNLLPSLVVPITALYPEAKKGDDFVEYSKSTIDYPNGLLLSIIESKINLNVTDFMISHCEEVKTIDSDKLSGFSGFQQWLVKSINGLSKAFEKGFKTITDLTIPDLQPPQIIYSPDMTLPSPNDYPEGVMPEFIVPRKFNQKIMIAKIQNQLLNLGWTIHDMRFLGEGKSSTIPLMGNVLYLDNNYRNPSIELIEKMPYIPSRSEKGTYEINGRVKVDPNEEEIKQGEKIGLPNCHLKSAFTAIQSKGFEVDNDAICNKCPNKSICHIIDKDNMGFGYRGERASAISKIISTGQGRSHIKQLHIETLTSTFKDFPITIEEASKVNLTNSLIATVDDIDRTISKLTRIKLAEGENLKTFELINYLNELRELVINAHDIHYEFNLGTIFYGLDRTQIEGKIKPPELTEDELLILLREFDLDINSVIPDFVRVEKQGLDKETAKQAKRAEEFMKGEQKAIITENLKTLDNNWFCRFLNILFGYEKGSFRITKNNEFEVITKDSHHIDIAKNAKRLLLLDATATTAQLKALYEIDKPIITFKTELPPLKNLKVINVDMKGMKSNNWSDNLIERLCLLKSELGTIHNDNIAFLTPKKYSQQLGTNYYFGRDDRGSNELMSYSAIAHLGVPMPNLGDAKIVYDLYFSGIPDYSFEDYYLDQIRENQLQALGRSRVQHSPDKNFTHYFIGTDQNFDWLNQFGVNVENINVIDICKEAGSKGDKTKKLILDTAKAILENGQKLTQKTIATIANISQQLVSKVFSQGKLSWKKFKFLLLNLYSSYKEKVVFSIDQDDILKMWLDSNDSESLESLATEVINHGEKALIEIAQGLNASLETCYRFLLLLAPNYDRRIEFLLDPTLFESEQEG